MDGPWSPTLRVVGWSWRVSLGVLGVGFGCESGSAQPDSMATDAATSSATTQAGTGGEMSATGSEGSTSGPGPQPSPYRGAPIDVPADGAWHFVEIEGMACGDGAPSGVGVRRVEGSNKLVLYFKGGGACFNPTTCGFTQPLMQTGPEAMEANPTGVLDFDRETNPLLDYNAVYFPYCTGDVHAGVSGETVLDGVDAPWRFVGHHNVVAGLERVAPTFADVDELVVLGTSAGGLGAMVNFPFIRRGWPTTDTLVIDDSGLVLTDEFLTPCLQEQLRDRWGITSVLPEDCESCTLPGGGGLASIFSHIPDTYPEVRFALIASNHDQILRLFYGFGNDECALDTGVPDLGSDRYAEALAALRRASVDGRFATFVIDSETHTWSTTPAFYSAQSNGVAMSEWFAEVLGGGMPTVEP